MKMKKLLISASAIVAGSGIITTVLTSCGSANVDEKLKIDLQSDGSFIAKLNKTDYKAAVKSALARSTGWTAFKSALADEIVYKWFEDRAATNKDTKDKNVSFRNFLDQAKYDIDKEYDKTINDLKAKYGSNHTFYLQNEYLSPNGGTEESYKHTKMVEKVRAEFVSKVFAFDYFGFADSEPTGPHPIYFTKLSPSPDGEDINNDTTWSKRIGFFAKANPNFTVNDMKDPNLLAKNPDGDYATIQNYVFDRWYNTEKPFFSAAALFKYSAPKSAEELKKVYNGTKTKLPDAPNEAFPYFGGLKESNSTATGAKAYVNWFNALQSGEFKKRGLYGSPSAPSYNGTISIPTEYSEDSQTLLLCFANQMIGGSENTLYTPYALSAASLLKQLFKNDSADVKNIIDQQDIIANINADPGKGTSFLEDDTRIFRNFFYTDLTSYTNVKSYIDLNNVYGGLNGDEYHCPLFIQNDAMTYLYGDITKSTAAEKSGVRYITNNVQVDLKASSDADTYKQPWILELNEAGMHAQTIDGYLYTAKETDIAKRFNTYKNVVKYRLLEQKLELDNKMISANVFGTSGALSSYFSKNFADIVLELATSADNEQNIFRPIESFRENATNEEKNFFTTAIENEKLGVAIDAIKTYLDNTRKIDIHKKDYDAFVAANEKIYAYRTTQISNDAVNPDKSDTVNANGLLAPIALDCKTYDDFALKHYYAVTTSVISSYTNVETECTIEKIKTELSQLANNDFVKKVDSVNVNDTNNGFSPQIDEAKKVSSNRAWYRSAIIDKVMYSFMGSSKLANQIKADTYDNYIDNAFADSDLYSFDDIFLADPATGASKQPANNARASVLYASKLITGSNNFASYGASTASFIDTMNSAYGTFMTQKMNADGEYCDEQMNNLLFNTTVVYLAKNNFENFYKALNTKIGDNEKAMIGYMSKYNNDSHTWLGANYDPADLTATDKISNVYGWNANVANIYDEDGYAGHTTNAVTKTDRVNYDEYWHVVKNYKDKGSANNTELAGFLGIQTASSNALGACDSLKKAAFDNFAKSVYDSKNIVTNASISQDQGALFAWANPDTTECKTKYAVPEVKWGNNEPITNDSFDDLPTARKLAKQISTASTTDDLKEIAASIDKALMNKQGIFHLIAKNQYQPTDLDNVETELKYKMLEALLSEDNGELVYKKSFDRLCNVELRDDWNGPFCFKNGDDGYKLFLTQINKCDVSEKQLTPTFDENTGWSMNSDTITMDEFWYIFCKMATESTNQQQAIADAVKVTFGDDKLQVYDAQLYNQFDSVWIKDWEKKPIGPS